MRLTAHGLGHNRLCVREDGGVLSRSWCLWGLLMEDLSA